MTAMDSMDGASVSVIIPTYNRSTLLVEAVESVLAQTYQAHEIIIVDDASDAPHRWALEALAHRSPRILVQALARHGERSNARNVGLAIATGDYVLFLDDDDLLDAGMIAAAMRRSATDPSADVIVGRGQRFGDVGPSFAAPLNPFWVESAANFDGWTSLWTGIPAAPDLDLESHPVRVLLKWFPPINAFVVRRDAIGATRFSEDVHRGEDWLFLLELAVKGCRFRSSPDVRSYVRLHSGNLAREGSAGAACGRVSERVEHLGREEAFLAASIWARSAWLEKRADWWRPAIRLVRSPGLLLRYGGGFLGRHLFRLWLRAAA